MSKFDVYKFIELVKSHRVLYDRKFKVLNKKKVVQQCWLKITEVFTPGFQGMSKKEKSVECEKYKTKWKSITDNMRRTVKSEKYSYTHCKQMEFMIPHLGRKWKSANRRQQGSGNETSESNNTQVMDRIKNNPHLLSLLKKLENNTEYAYYIQMMDMLGTPEIVSAVCILFQLPEVKRFAMLAEFIISIKNMLLQYEAESALYSSEPIRCTDSPEYDYSADTQYAYEDSNVSIERSLLIRNDTVLNGFQNENLCESFSNEDVNPSDRFMDIDGMQMSESYIDLTQLYEVSTAQDIFSMDEYEANLIQNMFSMDEQETTTDNIS